jgi:hypothetical protein
MENFTDEQRKELEELIQAYIGILELHTVKPSVRRPWPPFLHGAKDDDKTVSSERDHLT